MTVPAERGRPEREALVQISWSPVVIQAPTNGTALSMTPLKASLVRVWEPEPPEGIEPLEWILVTSVAVNTAEDAWQRVTWYKWRWLSEDFHKVLKTAGEYFGSGAVSAAAEDGAAFTREHRAITPAQFVTVRFAHRQVEPAVRAESESVQTAIV